MNQNDLDRIFNSYAGRLNGGADIDRRRLELLDEIFDDQDVVDENQIAVALCALGPMDAGPLPHSLFDDVMRLIPTPFEALKVHYSAVARIQQEIVDNDGELERASVGKQRLKESLDKRDRLRDELKRTKEDNPAVQIAVWFGLVGRARPFGRDWLGIWPMANAWRHPWSMAEVWLNNQVTRACAFVDGLIEHWNKGFLTSDVTSFIVDRLARPKPEGFRLSEKTELSFDFKPIPASDGPSPTVDETYDAVWDAAGIGVFIGKRPIAYCRSETRFVFRTTDHPLEGQGTEGPVLLPADTRIVCRCGDLEGFIQGSPGVRLKETRPRITWTPRHPTKIFRAHCDCGSLNCDTKHSIRKWDAGAAPFISLKDFVWNAVKGPMAVSKKEGNRRDVIKLLPSNAKQGMYYPFLASGKGMPAHTSPIRHARSMVWQCDSPECKPKTLSEKSKKGQTPSEIKHAPGCDKAKTNVKRVEDVLFIPFDRRTYTLRPYWGPSSNLRPCTLRDQDIINHPMFLSAARLSCPDDKTVTSWFAGLRQCDIERDVLLQILPSHLEEHPPDWDDVSEKIEWLKTSAFKRFAYGNLVNAFTARSKGLPSPPNAKWWSLFEQFVSQSGPWFFLLVNGYPPGLHPPRRLLRYEQYNLIIRAGLKAGEGGMDMRRAPKYLWTKDEPS